MSNFHVDTKTGDPQVCDIKSGGSCPLGFTVSEHFEREETARQHFEDMMREFTIPSPLKRGDL